MLGRLELVENVLKWKVFDGKLKSVLFRLSAINLGDWKINDL